MSLLLRNLLFTVLVPGTVAVCAPQWISGGRAGGGGVTRAALAIAAIALGAALYAWCVAPAPATLSGVGRPQLARWLGTRAATSSTSRRISGSKRS